MRNGSLFTVIPAGHPLCAWICFPESFALSKCIKTRQDFHFHAAFSRMLCSIWIPSVTRTWCCCCRYTPPIHGCMWGTYISWSVGSICWSHGDYMCVIFIFLWHSIWHCFIWNVKAQRRLLTNIDTTSDWWLINNAAFASHSHHGLVQTRDKRMTISNIACTPCCSLGTR